MTLASFVLPYAIPYIRPVLTTVLTHALTAVVSMHLNMIVCWAVTNYIVDPIVNITPPISFAIGTLLSVVTSVSYDRLYTANASTFNIDKISRYLLDNASEPFFKRVKLVAIGTGLVYFSIALVIIDFTNSFLATSLVQFVCSTVIYETLVSSDSDYYILGRLWDRLHDYRTAPSMQRVESFELISDFVSNDNAVAAAVTLPRPSSTTQLVLSDGFMVTEEYARHQDQDQDPVTPPPLRRYDEVIVFPRKHVHYNYNNNRNVR